MYNIASIWLFHFLLMLFTGNAQKVMPKKESQLMPPLNDTSLVIANGATLQLISNQFSFTEGPAVDKQGNIFFTDQPNDKIWKYGVDGMLSLFIEKAGRSNGLTFDKQGNLLSCADQNNEIWSITPDKKVTILVTDYNGQKLNGPNDLWVHPNGGLYFTDPYYQRSYWTRKSPGMKGEYVYYFSKGKELMVADSNLIKPNGIVGSADGKFLFVADIKDKKTYRYTINGDGTLSNRELFTEQGSDGMTIDHLGNIYLTGNGVSVYNPQGKKIEQIDVPAKWTANLVFGGSTGNTLFITASESVFILEMKVKGVE